jgi:hypothetical protein
MPEKLEDGIIYYRGKGDALGSVIVGAILVVFSWIVLTMNDLHGIPFSDDLKVMSTYLALPLGAVLFLANLRHVLSRRPTVIATDDGITILFTKKPIGLIRWTSIEGFRGFRHNGQWYLGIMLEDPEDVLAPFRGHLSPVMARFGPPEAVLKIKGKMLDDEMNTVVHDLEERRRLRSWRAV